MAVAVRLKLDAGDLKRLNAAMSRLSPKENKAVRTKALKLAALNVQKLAKTRYIRLGGGPVHPKRLTSRTGRLRNSIQIDLSRLPDQIGVGTSVIYGLVHETGGRHHPPRPFLQPALNDTSREYERILTAAWRGTVGA